MGVFAYPQKGARYEFEWNVAQMSAAALTLSLRAASSYTIAAPLVLFYHIIIIIIMIIPLNDLLAAPLAFFYHIRGAFRIRVKTAIGFKRS
jgi:hypothetical protein